MLRRRALAGPRPSPHLGGASIPGREQTHVVFDFVLTNKNVYALYERLKESGAAYTGFTYVIPVAIRTLDQVHSLEVVLDRSAAARKRSVPANWPADRACSPSWQVLTAAALVRFVFPVLPTAILIRSSGLQLSRCFSTSEAKRPIGCGDGESSWKSTTSRLFRILGNCASIGLVAMCAARFTAHVVDERIGS